MEAYPVFCPSGAEELHLFGPAEHHDPHRVRAEATRAHHAREPSGIEIGQLVSDDESLKVSAAQPLNDAAAVGHAGHGKPRSRLSVSRNASRTGASVIQARTRVTGRCKDGEARVGIGAYLVSRRRGLAGGKLTPRNTSRGSGMTRPWMTSLAPPCASLS